MVASNTWKKTNLVGVFERVETCFIAPWYTAPSPRKQKGTALATLKGHKSRRSLLHRYIPFSESEQRCVQEFSKTVQSPSNHHH